jgi:pimeloyl-ACP methyl ester carboxylesterase
LNSTDPVQSTLFENATGLMLAADMGGPEAGQPVILLHGGGQTRHSWNKAFSELVATGYRVTAPDLRGHGDSQWCTQGNYTLDDYIVDLGLIMDALPSAPILVGASLGGVVSLIGLGEQLLPRARALVLVDVVPRMELAGVQEIIDFMSANPGGFVSIDAAADAVAQYLPHRPRRSSREGLLKNLRQRDDGRYYWHWDPAIHSNASSPGYIEAMAQRMEAAARLIDIPTLVVRGGQSRVVSPEGVAHLAKLIPQASYVDVASAGHMVAGDHNNEFNAVIREFLASSCGGA